MVMRRMIALLLALTATVEAQKQPPHIIFILADDLGWNDVSFHGSGQIPTPNIDALAYDGIILNNYYVSPICTPTRSAILTGRHPIHTGQQVSTILGSCPYGVPLNETLMPQYLKKLGYSTRAVGKDGKCVMQSGEFETGQQVDTILGSRPYGVPLNETLMPQYLKKCGYATHIVGKWHMGFFAKEYTPLYRGFDTHYGYYCGHTDYYDHRTIEGNGYWGYDMRRNMSVDRSASNKYTTDLFTEEAVTVINSHDKSKPLFLYLAHLATHSANSYSPLQAPQKYLQKVQHIKHKQRRLFGGMAVGLDESVGQVVQALKANNMLDSSIIVFSTDNGGPASGFDMNYANNAPLRGVKDTLWEGGVRGVGFIWSRLLRKTRRVSQQMMHITDWLPTLYHAAGGDTGELVAPDGISMWPALSGGGASPRNEILHNIDDVRHIAALRRGDWKIRIGHTYAGHWDGWYELPEATVRAPDSAFVTPLTRILGDPPRPHDWESVVISCGKKPDNASVNCRPTVAPCLFNIRDDPCEYNNMAAARPDVVSALLGRLAMYNATQVKPANKPIDPKSNPKFYDYVWTWWKTLDANGHEHYVLNDL